MAVRRGEGTTTGRGGRALHSTTDRFQSGLLEMHDCRPLPLPSLSQARVARHPLIRPNADICPSSPTEFPFRRNACLLQGVTNEIMKGDVSVFVPFSGPQIAAPRRFFLIAATRLPCIAAATIKHYSTTPEREAYQRPRATTTCACTSALSRM